MGTRREEAVRRTLAEHGVTVGTIRLLGAGLDHAAYEVDGSLVVRIATTPARTAEVVREAELLTAVAAVVPLPVPVPRFVDAERGCMAYDRLPGRPALEVDGVLRHASGVGAALGSFLAALHREPVDRYAHLVPVDETTPAAWLVEARALHERLADHLPVQHRVAVEAFLGSPPPAEADHRVLSHDDLGIEHVLVDPVTWQVTGIIDWSDAAITDPARDLGLVLRDLGPDGLDAALGTYGPVDDDVLSRATFHARCGALVDFAHGIETGRIRYATKSITALAWLFPATGSDVPAEAVVAPR